MPNRIPIVRTLLLLAFVTSMVLTGCTSTNHQRFYFAAAEVDNPEQTALKFYRVNIKAKSANKNLKLHTGFYDANAVRQLYGNVPNPDAKGTEFTSTSGPRQLYFNEGTGSWEVLDDQLFTIVFGADADALAEQVQAFVNADTDGKLLGSLMAAAVNGDQIVKANVAESSLQKKQSKDKLLSEAVKGIAAGLKDNPNKAEAEKALQEAIRLVSAAIGAESGIPTSALPNPGDVNKVTEFFRQQLINQYGAAK